MAVIQLISARWVLDSRGNPTIQAFVKSGNIIGTAIVPSGASTGLHEALELRDHKKAFHGLGVHKAVKNVNKVINKRLKGVPLNQELVDKELIQLDGTPNKQRLGANAILSVSLATARACAMLQGIEVYDYIAELWQGLTGIKSRFRMPKPMANIINGGKHAGNGLSFQEFLVVPSFKSFEKNTQAVSEVYHTLKQLLIKRFGAVSINVGDEGGFAPNIKDPEQALELIQEAISLTGYKKKMGIALDVAASELYHNNHYLINNSSSSIMLNFERLSNLYLELIKDYGVISIEDPFDQDHYSAWQYFMKLLQQQRINLQIVGDDLLVTNPKRIEYAISQDLCNALLLKPNQIGTLTEALRAAYNAKQAGWNIIVSHRSGDSEDSFIADLSVGINSEFIKLGAPCRGERTAKYNRLLVVEGIL